MSCGCHTSPCAHTTCDAENEPLSSALQNFQSAFFGSITKTCVNGQIVWTLPCDLDTGLEGFPRIATEGLACYFMRIFSCVVGLGYTETTLTNQDQQLFVCVNTQIQEYNGTLTGPVIIDFQSQNAFPGAKFVLSLTGIVTSAAETLTLRSAGTTVLQVFSGVGTLTGFVDVAWTGTEWRIIKNYTDLV